MEKLRRVLERQKKMESWGDWADDMSTQRGRQSFGSLTEGSLCYAYPDIGISALFPRSISAQSFDSTSSMSIAASIRSLLI